MKSYFISIALIFCMGTFCLAQQGGAPFNVERSRQELSIMKGILGTSLAFSLSDEGREQSAFGSSNIDAFYLSGQGAVFMIPTSNLYKMGGLLLMPEFSEQMINLNERYLTLSQQMASQAEQLASTAQQWNQGKSGTGSGQGSDAVLPQPSAPPPPQPAPAAVQAPRASAQKEEIEARKAEYRKNLEKARSQLIETLANYGDSLTTVQSGEYINLILTGNNYTIGVYSAGIYSTAAGQQATHEVISARKSWITDYKAGRISLEDFKQKVIRYSN